MKKIMNSKIILFILSMMLVAAMAFSFAGCEKEEIKDDSTSVKKALTVVVTELDGTKTEFEFKTSAETVGEALLEQKLVTIENGMVLSVNGKQYEYSADGVYWAFYINGEYGMTGVEQTEIVEGAVYGFTATKA